MSHSISVNPQRWARGLYKTSRYKILYGGRGGGKSYEVADYLIVRAHTQQTIILCAREFQNSIKDSVHALISARIEALGLADWFDIQKDTIISKVTGTAFIFKGIRHNIQSIKSMFGIGVCWVEEAQTISRESWEILKPTIREEGSEIICTLNPLFEADPIYHDFIATQTDGAWVQKVNWMDNKHFPEVLNQERMDALRKNTDTYSHIWEGELLRNTDAQVFKGKFIMDDFVPGEDWDGPYHGMDFGFAKDPTTAVRCWIHDDRLWIEYEAYRVGLEIDDTADYVKSQVPGIELYQVRADNARPESISYLRRNGLPNCVPCEKGKGSVMDGIEFIKSFEQVVIHSRCHRTYEEFTHYSYKTDRLSGDILPVIIDDHNHLIDAIRYSIEPIMKARVVPYLTLDY